MLFSSNILDSGRLYVNDWDGFRDRIERLIIFAKTYAIQYILSCHIEMSIDPKLDSLNRISYQPYERPLQMTVAQLPSICYAIEQIQGRAGIDRFEDYSICKSVPTGHFSDEAIDSNAEPGAIC